MRRYDRQIMGSKMFIGKYLHQRILSRQRWGGALIPLALVLQTISIQGIPGIHVMDMILILSVCINGFPIVVGAVKGIVCRRMNVDELVSIAIVAFMVNGNYLEAAIVSAIMVTGALIEEAVSDSARHAIESLVQKRPDTAFLEKKGSVTEVKAAEIVKGDIIVVKPGGMIPVDGSIIEGISGVDESAVTGESIPKEKRIGDAVWAGTLNTDGYIRVAARRVGKDATMGRIIDLVLAAEQSKIESGKIVDRYAAWFTPVILSAAVVTFLVTHDVGPCRYRSHRRMSLRFSAGRSGCRRFCHRTCGQRRDTGQRRHLSGIHGRCQGCFF